MIAFDDYWLTLIVGTLLPILVALVTKQVASGTVKSLTLLLLTAIGGALTSIQAAGGSFEWDSALTSFVISYVISVASYYGLWKPTQIAGSDGAAAKVAPNVGVG